MGGGSIDNILEIGCSSGYNLDYLSKRFSVECYGIEPSDRAIRYGNMRYAGSNSRIHLTQGISSKLPYADNMFDVVIVGFLLYVTPREIISNTVLEIDRVTKEGGLLVITDFDTPIPCKRENIHNVDMPTYKEDYARRFIPMGYSVVEKTSYSHNQQDVFNIDIQERISTQILYKEFRESMYAIL